MLTLTVEGRRVTQSRWTPLRIGANGVPATPPAATAKAMTTSFEAARRCTDLSGAVPPS